MPELNWRMWKKINSWIKIRFSFFVFEKRQQEEVCINFLLIIPFAISVVEADAWRGDGPGKTHVHDKKNVLRVILGKFVRKTWTEGEEMNQRGSLEFINA